MSDDLLSKLIPHDQETARVAGLPRPLVFTNGVFDILHRGHISYLTAARSLGATLLVALNSDASARRLGKGPDRPLNRELDRACLLGALQAVDALILFDEPTPLVVLARVKPDIYVKGGDYEIDTLPEAPLVRSWGGHALVLPFVSGYSTTGLVQSIRGKRP